MTIQNPKRESPFRESCLKCRFSHDTDGDGELLECRRHAPKPVIFQAELYNDAQTEWGWPIVNFDEWCGEFSSKKATKGNRK